MGECKVDLAREKMGRVDPMITLGLWLLQLTQQQQGLVSDLLANL